MNNEPCGSQISTRIPDAPSDQWETATCIWIHDVMPAPIGTVHDSGDGTRWVELDGFTELDDEDLALIFEMAQRRP